MSLIFIGLVLILIFNDYNKGTFIVITVTAWLPGIIAIVYGFVAPKKTLVFNRLKGIITVAPRFQKEFDIPFETGVGIRAFTHRDTGGVDQHLSFSVSKEKKRKGGIISMVKVDNSWAFMVWYMDRNRPLPPGEALDPYRQKDYERRKAEGFLEPLHPSYIETPEHFTDEYKLMNEKNRTIPGRYKHCLNDNYEEKVKAYEERKKRNCQKNIGLIK